MRQRPRVGWLIAIITAQLVPCASQAAPEPAAAPAQHAPPPLTAYLDYERGAGAQGCVAPGALREGVEQRLGRDVFVDRDAADMTVQIRAAREGQRFKVRIELVDRDGVTRGRRRLDTRARHCSALDDSLALVVALAVDIAVQSRIVEPSVPAPDVPPPSTPAPAAPLAAPPVPETGLEIPETVHAPRATESEPLRWRASIGGALASGVLPSAAAGMQARLELEPARFWPIGVDVTFWHGQRLGEAAGADFALRTLKLDVCPWTLERARWALLICASELVGIIEADGFGFDRSPRNDDWLVAAGASVHVRYGVSMWFVQLSGSLLGTLVQRRYFYTDANEVTLYEAPWVLGLGAASLGLEF